MALSPRTIGRLQRHENAWKPGRLKPRTIARAIIMGDSLTDNGFGSAGTGPYASSVSSDGNTITWNIGNATIAAGLVGNYVHVRATGLPGETALNGATLKVLSNSGTNITTPASVGPETMANGTSYGPGVWQVTSLMTGDSTYFTLLNTLLRNCFTLVGVYSLGGFGSELLSDSETRWTHGPDFDFAFILIGQNDISAGKSADYSLANISAAEAKIRNLGKVPVLITVNPFDHLASSGSIAKTAESHRLAGLIKSYAVGRGLPYFDLHTLLANPDNSFEYRANYSGDGIHTRYQGLYPALNIDGISEVRRLRERLRLTGLDFAALQGSVLTNGQMNGSGANAPTGWAHGISGSLVYTDASGVPRSDGQGNEWEISYTASGASNDSVWGPSMVSTLTGGQWYRFGMDVRFLADTVNVSQLSPRLFINGYTFEHFTESTGQTGNTSIPFEEGDAHQLVSQPVFIQPGTISSALFGFRIRFSGAGSANIAVSRAFVTPVADPYA